VFRRFNVDADAVDAQGSIAALQLDPVPSAMLKAARDLTLPEANTVMGYQIQAGKFTLKASSTPYAEDWRTGIVTPQPSTRVVVQPTTMGGIAYAHDAVHQTIIDNLDQRMLIALYRLTRWLNSSAPDVSAILQGHRPRIRTSQRLPQPRPSARLLGCPGIVRLDYLVHELRTQFAGVNAVIANPAITVDQASDEVVYNFEVPGAILQGGVKLPRTDARVQQVFAQRRPLSQAAMHAHLVAHP
jgi:hypothetical protein